MSNPFGGAADLIRGDGVHLGALSAVLAQRYGDRPAVDDPAPTPGLHAGGQRSFVDLEEAVGRLAAAHRAAGVEPGVRVLVITGNRVDVLLHTFALARLGAVPVPVTPTLTPGEVAAVVTAADAARAIVDDDLVPGLREHEDLADLPMTPTGDRGTAAWVAAHDDRVDPVERDPATTTLLLTTSGTTGVPKAAALTSQGLLAALGRLVALPVGRPRGLRAGRDLVLAALPLTHVMGFSVALGTLCAGVPMLRRERFDAVEALALVEDRRPNVFVGVPTMYADLEAAGAADRDLTSVQLWISAADAMPADRARRFQRYGAIVHVAGRAGGSAAFLDIYGMVELSGAAAIRIYPPSPADQVRIPAFAVALPGVDVRVVDDDGHDVGRGQLGELQFRGSGVLERYEGHDAGPDGAGWFATGDYGRIWPGRILQLAGRSRDRLKVGGFSVFPAEVEQELRTGPGVREVALVGVPDERLGERPVALVVPGDDFDRDGFLDWARATVAGYRRPRAVVTVDALPKGNNAKIDRRAATELAAEQLGTAEAS